WVKDKRVQNWLESWGYIDYLEKIKEDYSYIQGAFTKFYLAKGVRVGKPSIAKLEHISPEEARLATDIHSRSYKPKYCVITDWNFAHLYGCLEGIRRSTAIPIILKALPKNSSNLIDHDISLAKLWGQAEKELKEKATEKNPYAARALLGYKKDCLRQIPKALS